MKKYLFDASVLILMLSAVAAFMLVNALQYVGNM
jgi:hypothetical protein